MLTYALVWIVALGSLGLYLATFIYPEVHRKNDVIWSVVGLFYALILWVYAKRITGGLLLGQTASVALIVWLGWQTLKQRNELAPAELQPEPDSIAAKVRPILIKVGELFQDLQSKLQQIDWSKLAPSTEGATAPADEGGEPSEAEGPVGQFMALISTLKDRLPNLQGQKTISVESKPEAVSTPAQDKEDVLADPNQPIATPTTEESAEPKATDDATDADTQPREQAVPEETAPESPPAAAEVNPVAAQEDVSAKSDPSADIPKAEVPSETLADEAIAESSVDEKDNSTLQPQDKVTSEEPVLDSPEAPAEVKEDVSAEPDSSVDTSDAEVTAEPSADKERGLDPELHAPEPQDPEPQDRSVNKPGDDIWPPPDPLA